MNARSSSQLSLKALYIFLMISVFIISILIINGIGGWITIYGDGNFSGSHIIRGIFLLVVSMIMFYGYVKYDDSERGLREKLIERQALIVRFLQIMGITLICLFLFLTS